MIAGLGHIARHGRIGLVLGLLAGVLLPDVALMLRPWLPEMIGLLLFLTALRIGATQAVGSIGALGQSAKIVWSIRWSCRCWPLVRSGCSVWRPRRWR